MKIEDVYALSPLQKGMYYHWLTSPTSYFEQVSYRLKGRLDIGLLEKSYQAIVDRHAVLRTFFTHKFGEEVLQVVKKEVEPVFSYKDVSSDSNFSFKEFKKEDRNKGFDLTNGSQMRLHILKVEHDTYEFVWSQHHILMDGWCISILIKEFFQIYEAFKSNRTPTLDPIVPYSNYIKWLEKVDESKSKEYWKDYLLNYDTKISPPQKMVRGVREVIKEATLEIKGKTREKVADVCSNLGITENVFIQTVWGVLLAKYNRTNDAVFGSVVSGRPAEILGVEKMVGLFINTIPVRIQSQKGVTAKELLKQVMKESITSTHHHYIQLSDLLEESELRGDLFNHLLVFENFPMDESMKAVSKDDIVLVDSEIYEHNNYDFTLAIVPREESIDFRFKYNESLYDSSMIQTLKNHFENSIKAIAENTDVIIDELDYLSENEKKQVIFDFNYKTISYNEERNLVCLLEERFKKTPNEVAVIYEDKSITYKELEEQSNEFAHYLKSDCGIGIGDSVVVKLEKTEWIVIALLGILKAGGVYVPVDINYPNQRVQFIIEDSNCKVVIDEEKVEDFKHKIWPKHNNLEVTISKDDLAYIIYTSGTTGKPKGVMVEHKNIVWFLESTIKEFQLERLKFPLFASNAFDISLFDMFYSLVSGGSIIIINSNNVKDINYVVQSLKKANAIQAVPALMGQILNYIKSTKTQHEFKGIKNLFIGGDMVPTATLKEMREVFTEAAIHELYGPTESTVFVTANHYEPTSKEEEFNGALIGKPISNASIYILDDNNLACGIGVIGEICVGGGGVTRGYLNRKELTEERFVEVSYNVNNRRVYKSGDLGKWNHDGTIEIIGRKDNQVKVRGYRIELNEIEENILNIDNVTSVVVTTTEVNNEKELIAYIVSSKKIEKESIKSELGKVLPTYMVPNYYLQLDEIPLTANSKIDRKRLPVPDETILTSRAFYVEPNSETEKKMVSIWQEILNINDKIGIKDNFFNLGGHSIKATRLITEIYKHFKIELSISVLFETSTLEELSKEIDNIVWVNTTEDFSDVETEDITI